MVNGYRDLFQPDSQDALQAEYEAIVGDSFDVVDPSTQQLFDGANQEVNEAAQSICADLTRGSLGIDKAILVKQLLLKRHTVAHRNPTQPWVF